MSEGPKSRRRWFQFSLRTLFVAITLAGLVLSWIMWNVRQVQMRERATRYIVTHFGNVIEGTSDRPWKSLPFMWQLLGAKPVELVRLGHSYFSDEDRDQIARLFPDADVSYDSHDHARWR